MGPASALLPSAALRLDCAEPPAISAARPPRGDELVAHPAVERQRVKAVHVQRLDRYDRRRHQWREIVVEDRRAGPDHVVMVRLDFAAWLESLTSRNRRIAERLAAGAAGQDIARRFGISPGRVSLATYFQRLLQEGSPPQLKRSNTA